MIEKEKKDEIGNKQTKNHTKHRLRATEERDRREERKQRKIEASNKE